jgi:hypothetical protein
MGPGGQEEFVSGRYMGAPSSGDCGRSAGILNATSSDYSDSATEGTPFPLPLAQSHRLRNRKNFCRIVDPGGRTSRRKGGGWSCRKWVERSIPRNLINHTEEEWEVGFRVFSLFLSLPISNSRPTQLLQQLEINKAKQKSLGSSISTTVVVGGCDWGVLRVGMTGVLGEASC